MQKIPIASLMMACLVVGCISAIKKPTQTSSARAETSGVPLPLKRPAECMFKVLKTVPGVSEPRLDNATGDGWTHPFLEYRAAEGSQWVEPTRFDAQKNAAGGFSFVGILPGVGPLDTHVTNVVVEQWKTQCGVEAMVILA
jgi:hypothetical protein